MVASNSPECNILIIDDEPAARYVVAGLFRAENCITYAKRKTVSKACAWRARSNLS